MTDSETGQPVPDVHVIFQDSKIGTFTDSLGRYVLETYYASDVLEFYYSGYKTEKIEITKDIPQIVDVVIKPDLGELEEFVVLPSEFPSTRLHKKIIAHKDVNNREKLSSYGYELYNKIEVDVNNIGDKFSNRDIVQKLDVVLQFLDTSNGQAFLPVILSETVSDFTYQNHPKKKKEVIQGTYTTGIENLHFNQFLGEMYLDFNIYDNYLILFNHGFVSPVANFARSYYRFYLQDSSFIDNQWCYLLTFRPKRSGDLAFVGEMWVHDTTYAIKSFKANISPNANLNFVNDFYFYQKFEQVEKEVWMMTEENMIADLKLTKKTGFYGAYGRKYSSRRNFVINKEYPPEYFKTENTVEIVDGATKRDSAWWNEQRHGGLTVREKGVQQMIDSLEADPFFRFLKKSTYTLATGYYPVGYIEIGNIYTLASYNQVEHFRSGFALRTSNKFSRRLELGGRLFYGFGDQRFKYGTTVRYNITPKKRGMWTTYYNYDIEQIGASPTAASVGSSVSTLIRTGPLDKLTFVDKVGTNLEKDIGKDLIIFGGFEWKQYTALGKANYERYDDYGNLENISRIRTAEATIRLRYAKNEEFISGSFDRSSVGSKYPILSLQAIFGIKGIAGSNYNYQKIEFNYDHSRSIGVLGRLHYSFNCGYIFGTAAYPFLKVHEGSQSFWLYTNAFNKLGYFEFISDKYVTGLVEQHWEGLFFDRIPLMKKLKWRLVTTGRITYGDISDRHQQAMLLPSFTKRFNGVPYAEANIGIENIFKFGRIDLVWRLTHLDPGMSPLGVRARFAFSF